MKTLKRSIYFIIFITLLYAILGFKIVPIILKDQLIKNLDENLTLKSNIEKIEFNPFTIKLKIYDFKLFDENNNSDISFKELNIDFALLRSIEKRHISFKNAFLDELFLNIKEDKDGIFNFAKILKPTIIETQKEDSNSFDIKFLISKIDLKNADINFTSLINEQPFTLNLQDINYTIYDLGTYKNALSSNDLNFKINEDTIVSIGGATKLEPFKMYGKISISNLKIKEFLDFKQSLFNFDINKESNINLILNYNIDTSKDLDLQLSTDLFEINNLNLKQKNKTLINLKKLDIKRFDFDLNSQNIKLDGLNIDDLNTNLVLDKMGINLTTLINTKTSTTNEKVQETKTEENKPWIINLSNIQINNNINFEDKINNISIKTKNDLNLKNIEIIDSKINFNELMLNSSNLNFIDNKNRINLNSKNLNLLINDFKLENNNIFVKTSSLKIPNLNFEDKNSKINLSTFNTNLNLDNFLFEDNKITINDIKLSKADINFKDLINKIDIKTKNTQLNINHFMNKSNDLSVDYIKLLNPNLNFINLENETKIDVKNFDLQIKKLSNQKNLFKIEKTNLNNPHISITLPKNTQEKNDKKEEIESTKIVKTQEKQNLNKTKLNIGPVNINNATFDFEDKNLPLPFKTTITKLNGKISEIKNNKSSKTNLEVNGVVDSYGVAKITGIVNPNNIKFLTDINMKFKNIAMQNFTPYTGKFIGRELKSGKLDLDLNYNIQESNLNAKNNIVITKLELGEKIESPDAVSLPLEIAITLLEDKNSVIDIDLPVSGNVDDPQFSIGLIVWKAFVNLITKAVTAPFSLLGSMFNFSEDEISSVKFELLEDEITPIQKETLDKIAQILIAKQEIAIKLLPSYDKDKETFALKEKKYLARKDDDRKLSKEEIKSLIEKESIKPAELEKIAKNRILHIKDYLIKEKSINIKQIILTEEMITSSSSINLKIEQIK